MNLGEKKMNIKSLSDIPEAVFYPLKTWADQSIGNFNLFIGLSFLFVVISAIFVITYSIKIGRSDERTTLISLKSAYAVLVAIIVCDMIFPRNYLINQFFMLKYGIACFTGGMYLFLQYRKDFN
jgi:hypothetical protein